MLDKVITLPLLGRNRIRTHISSMFGLAFVALLGLFIFFVVSFYLGLGVDILKAIPGALS